MSIYKCPNCGTENKAEGIGIIEVVCSCKNPKPKKVKQNDGATGTTKKN